MCYFDIWTHPDNPVNSSGDEQAGLNPSNFLPWQSPSPLQRIFKFPRSILNEEPLASALTKRNETKTISPVLRHHHHHRLPPFLIAIHSKLRSTSTPKGKERISPVLCHHHCHRFPPFLIGMSHTHGALQDDPGCLSSLVFVCHTHVDLMPNKALYTS